MDVSERSDRTPGPAGRSDAGDRLGADGSAGAEAVRVVVVDDQAPFRAAARAVLARTPGFAWWARRPTGRRRWPSWTRPDPSWS